MVVRWQDWMNLLLGLWLIGAPLLMAYEGGYGGTAAWNSYLAGGALVIVTGIDLAKPVPWREWIILALAIWLILSPFVLGLMDNLIPLWNGIITGVIVAIGSASALGADGKGARGA